MPKVSIIIAMYNIEDYIAYCINSCINQLGVKPSDYEIIIVNDGATDNSLQVAQESIKGVNNARIISRVNGGLSAARNTGIEAAKGEYLWFVDGDDAISQNAINIIISNIKQSNCDAYIINFSTFDGKNKINTSNFKGFDIPLSGEEYHFNRNRILPMMAWLTIYKSEVLKRNNINFMPNIIHEDFEFSIRAHHISSSICFIKEDLYLYRISRNGSIMSESKKDNYKSFQSLLSIRNSFKLFFAGVDNASVRSLYGFCAKSLIFIYYNPSYFTRDNIKEVFSTVKISLYKDLLFSREFKFLLFMIFVICAPKKLISIVIPHLESRSKLM